MRWTAHDQRNQFNFSEEAAKVRAAYNEDEGARRDRIAKSELRLHDSALRRMKMIQETTHAFAGVEDDEEDWEQSVELDNEGRERDQDEQENIGDGDNKGEESEKH